MDKVRERCRQKILKQHSRMRLLSGQEIGVDQLYVDVWLLEKPERIHFNTSESLLGSFDIEKDRLALSKRIHRHPGFDIANGNPKLVILGKPGSGKTTFLKHLAIDWCKGKFQSEKIAILIELRRIQDSQWNIWSVVGRELGLDDWYQFAEVRKELDRLESQVGHFNGKQSILKKGEEQSPDDKVKKLENQLKSFPLHHFLEKGKLLIFMDGLDEAPTDKIRRNVQAAVKKVADTYPNGNRFILTCRTQIVETIPSNFSSVEVADFTSEQVRKFVQNWFISNGQTESEVNEIWAKVYSALANQPDLKELAMTPVLLSLICLVIQDERGKIPTDRGWLYRKGIKLLLSRWNDKKEIDGWEFGTDLYRQLSTEDKESLLIYIAARKFENTKNFVLFEQDELVHQVSNKLQLGNAKEGIAVLKAIEAQHGLLIERADELWSFSHLTFQEYFTVQWLIQLPPQQLVETISTKKLQKVVVQLVKSQQPADNLLRVIKYAIDQLIADNLVIQKLLKWLVQKSESVHTPYKDSAIRAFYYSLTFDESYSTFYVNDRTYNSSDFEAQVDVISEPVASVCDFEEPVREEELDLSYFKLDQTLDHRLKCALTKRLDQNLAIELDIDLALTSSLYQSFSVIRESNATIGLARALKLSLNPALSFYNALDRSIEKSGTRIPKLCLRIQSLKTKLPDLTYGEEFLQFIQWWEELLQWWEEHGQTWSAELRAIMLEHRNIGHNWGLTDDDEQELQHYFDTNKFLVYLMSIEGAVSEECRAEIEDGLLLPWAKLQRRQPHLYGEPEEF